MCMVTGDESVGGLICPHKAVGVTVCSCEVVAQREKLSWLTTVPDPGGQSQIPGAVLLSQAVIDMSRETMAKGLDPQVRALLQLYAHPWDAHTAL